MWCVVALTDGYAGIAGRLYAVVVALVYDDGPSDDRPIGIRQVHQLTDELVGRTSLVRVVAYVANVFGGECARHVTAVAGVEWIHVNPDAINGS